MAHSACITQQILSSILPTSDDLGFTGTA